MTVLGSALSSAASVSSSQRPPFLDRVDVLAQSYQETDGSGYVPQQGGYDGYRDRDSGGRDAGYRRRRSEEGGGVGVLSLFQNQKKLGATLLAVGVLLTMFGVMLFFESNLLRLGNICLIFGVTFLIGPSKVRGFFLKESRMQASIITSIGILLVFTGKPRFGILCEIFGLLNLFGNMFPTLLAIGRNIPILGDLIKSFDGSNKEPRYGNRQAYQQEF
jgi:hypothetical protein